MKEMPGMSNSRLLNSIFSDMKMWRAGRETPFQLARKWVTALCTAATILYVLNYVDMYSLAYLITLAVITASAAWVISSWFLRKKLASWPELIDRKLACYRPCDLAAWTTFQQLVRDKGEIELNDLAEWIDRETRFTAFPEKKRQVLFLENTPGDKAKD